MNFGLLWIDALFIALLWVTTSAACAGRLERRWLRWLSSFLCLIPPTLLLGVFTLVTAELKFSGHVEPNWFGYAASLFVAFLSTGILIVWRANRQEAGLASAAASWQRAPLALAFVAASAVGYIILLNMDVALRARCAILSVEANSIYLATLPAITSDAQNAAPLYEAAFAHLLADHTQEEKVHNPPTGNNEHFDPDEPATLNFLRSEAATIVLLRRAAALPGCRFDQDLAVPDLNSVMANLNECRNAGNTLSLDAREQLARGNRSTAIADVAAIFAMSRQLGQRPLLISALVGAGIDRIGFKTLELVLSSVKSSDELATLHLDELPSMGRVLQQALRGEERYGLQLYGDFPPTPSKDQQGREFQSQHTLMTGRQGGVVGLFFRAYLLDLDAYLDLMKNMQDAAPLPYFRVHDRVSSIFNLDHSSGILVAILAPSLTRSFTTVALGDADDACAQVAVAMTRFKLDHHIFPSRLDALVPTYLSAVPTDPFDGHPLRLTVRNNQWIIYSIGPDGVDDGGVELTHDKGDVTFTLSLLAVATTRP